MKAIHVLNVSVGVVSLILLDQVGLLTPIVFEEIVWFVLSISLFTYLHPYFRFKFLTLGFLLYITGLFMDVAEDILLTTTWLFDSFDTVLKNGGFLIICISMFSVVRDKKKLIEQLRFEIQQKNRFQKRLEKAAYYDELTKLPNRKALFERLEKERTDSVTIIYFDLDKFKQANDKHGHVVGDKVLVSFAINLKREFGDENAYRLGGDEFIVLSSEIFSTERMITLRPALCEGLTDYGVGVSAGFHLLAPEQQVDDAIHQADIMMYEDKVAREEKEIHPFPPKYRCPPRGDSEES